MDIIITHEETGKMLRKYKKDPAKFIEENMNIKLWQYQKDFINITIDENGGAKMYKQIIIARKDLNMSPGKFAAQVSHASMAFLSRDIKKHSFPITRATLSRLCKQPEPGDEKVIEAYNVAMSIDKDLYEQWLSSIFTKCILEAKNKNKLLKAKKMAEDMGMKENEDFFLIRDCCLTELEPEDEDGRTLTCIGFRPMDSEIIDKIGKKYQLYK